MTFQPSLAQNQAVLSEKVAPQSASLLDVEPNCGINSTIMLALLLGKNPDAQQRTDLLRYYNSTELSLLQVKTMCNSLGVPVVGVKGRLGELLAQSSSFIAALATPEHFTVVLDGDENQVRVRDSESSLIEIWPRKQFEDRFTGFALVPKIEVAADAPALSSIELDKFTEYDGARGEVAYAFSLANNGKSPLSLEIVGVSCGCTTALFDNGKNATTVLPGDTTHLNMSYTVGLKGLAQQIVAVKANLPLKPLLYFTLRSALPLDLTASPKSLFVSGQVGDKVLKYINVNAPPGTKMISVESTVSYLNAKVIEQQSDISKENWRIEVSGQVNPATTRSLGKIVINTSSSTLAVPVDGKITQIFAVEHDQKEVIFGAPQAALLPRAEDDPLTHIGSPLPTLKAGESAFDFAAMDMNGKMWNPSTLRGKNILLTFFPKCFTGGCANHLSSLRDRQSEFDKAQTQILAISVDAADGDKGQRAFAKQWGFTFPLIPDTSRQLGKQFGAIQNDDELAARMSVLIDKTGVVRWIDTDVQVQSHGADVLAKIAELGLNK